MQERANTAGLLRLSIQIEAIEMFVASIPGAANVDVQPIKEALQASHNTPYGDLVGTETQAHWVDVSVDRLSALSRGAPAPEFQK